MTDLKAGRELDAKVAVEVMGLSIRPHMEAQWEEGVTRDGKDGWAGFFCPACGTSDASYHEPCARHYSVGIAAAMDVFERIRTHYQLYVTVGEHAAFHRDDTGDLIEGCPWVCVIGIHFTKIAVAYAETAPLAICLAALKAVNA